MAAKQYELGSNVLDWYRDFCPGNSFQVVIRPDITFADVVVGHGERCRFEQPYRFR